MSMGITYRHMVAGEEREVFELVRAGFDGYVRTDLTDEGVSEFFRAAHEMIYHRPISHLIAVAESPTAIAGMIDIRDNSHICLFFVAEPFHRKGIGRDLLEWAIEWCLSSDQKIRAVDVNSSLFAVPAYRRLGFEQTKPEQLVSGIKFVPMSKTLRMTSG